MPVDQNVLLAGDLLRSISEDKGTQTGPSRHDSVCLLGDIKFFRLERSVTARQEDELLGRAQGP